jgi:hypothetical protein
MAISQNFSKCTTFETSVITNTQVFLPVFALIVFDLFVISLWAGLDLPKIGVEPDPIRAYVLVQRCEMKQKTVWFALLILPKLAVLIYGMQVSYQVRNIDKIFRESKAIAVSIIALFLCGAITIPILLLVWQQIDAAQILLTIGVTLSLISVALVLFVPKFWRIYTQDPDNDLDKSGGTLDMSTTSHSWRPDSRGGGGGGGAHSTAEEFNVLKTSGSAHGREPPSPTNGKHSPPTSTGNAGSQFEIVPSTSSTQLKINVVTDNDNTTPGLEPSHTSTTHAAKDEDFYVK